jgi:SAM-dependent methyltransferase
MSQQSKAQLASRGVLILGLAFILAATCFAEDPAAKGVQPAKSSSAIQIPTVRVEVVPPVAPPSTGIMGWLQAWGPVLAFVGVFITAYFTLRRGRLDARYDYAAEILKFRLRQLEEFYAPALLYLEQSRKVYDKLRWTIEREKKEIQIGDFRLLDYIFEFKKDKTFAPLVGRILTIGSLLTKLISEKAGLIEGGITPTFAEYQAHFEILNAAGEQELSKEQKEGWHKLGYYPRLLNREVREGYNVVLAHLEKYSEAGDRIISELLGQKSVQTGKYRQQLIDNLRFYEEHVKEYVAKFDKFDLSNARNTFLAEVTRSQDERVQSVGGIPRILDAGCGTGRDVYQFIRQGYAVTAIDASPAMLRECTKKIRAARESGETELVKQAANASERFEMSFREMRFRAEFDGIWAAASLLHVPSEEMEEIVGRLVQALKPGGILYMSFKYGRGEGDFDARFYSYYGRRRIGRLLNRFSEVEVIRIWLSDPAGKELLSIKRRWAWTLEFLGRFDRRNWLNVLVKRRRH